MTGTSGATELGCDEASFIARATAGGDGGLPVGPGDDAAVLADGTVVALDTVVEGVHFAPDTPVAQVAHKALGACLSDVCAMGAVAETVLVAAQLPPGRDALALADALAEGARHFGVVLAGGDTVRAPEGALALSVTATGRCATGRAPWLRSGGRVGDRLVVTGPLGGSFASGRHLRVRPRADVVAALRAAEAGGEAAADAAVHAALDLSDGLARDLPRLTTASGVGAVVDAAAVPIHEDVPADVDRLTAALGDGEDFELLLALGPDAPVPAGATVIGRLVEAAQGLRLQRDGEPGPWPEGGHEHVF